MLKRIAQIDNAVVASSLGGSKYVRSQVYRFWAGDDVPLGYFSVFPLTDATLFPEVTTVAATTTDLPGADPMATTDDLTSTQVAGQTTKVQLIETTTLATVVAGRKRRSATTGWSEIYVHCE